ncbi:ATP-binding protein [Streptomyces canus]|uniref:ATP-binding protein n=1 Tax=Streptomyces canus TaxID=58343 RepID=UPI002E3088DA|nr:ATP-binding protein [Streptomyces canus]
MTFPRAPALPEELDRLMRRMRLPYVRKAAPDVLATARAQRWGPAEVLRLLITEEVTGRDAATRRLRRTTANFPTGKTLASWRAEDSTIPEPTQNSLATLEWIGRAENLVIAGPSGTGKSHFTEGLAQAAIEKDLKVAWFSLETLSAAIGKSKVDGSTARTVARICRADLIVVDGEPLDVRRRCAVIVLPLLHVEMDALHGFFTTTNLSSSQWLMCAAVGSIILWAGELVKTVLRSRTRHTRRTRARTMQPQPGRSP